MDMFPHDAVIKRLIAKVEARNVSSDNLPSDVRSRLYYEAHVTVEPQVGETFRERLENVAKDKGWHVSSFLMLKHDNYDAFISFRGESLRKTCEAVQDVVRTLERCGFTVTRWKIEDTLFDSKRGDVL